MPRPSRPGMLRARPLARPGPKSGQHRKFHPRNKLPLFGTHDGPPVDWKKVAICRNCIRARPRLVHQRFPDTVALIAAADRLEIGHPDGREAEPRRVAAARTAASLAAARRWACTYW
jgi:hypothetical protein